MVLRLLNVLKKKEKLCNCSKSFGCWRRDDVAFGEDEEEDRSPGSGKSLFRQKPETRAPCFHCDSAKTSRLWC